MKTNPSQDAALTEARATIEEQKHHIELLRNRIEENRQADVIRGSYNLVTTARTIAAPVTHDLLLDMIVKTAARVLQAQSASLFLLDLQKQELTFEVAIGPKASEVKRHRVPLGHGIAGFVALSGQPLAIADAGNSELHASDISHSIGYVPNTILGIPLFYREQVIGVLELLNKEGGEHFDSNDIELGGIFANQAAVAIELSRTHGYLIMQFADLLQTEEPQPHAPRDLVLEYAHSFTQKLEKDSIFKESLEFATLVQELIWYGETERKICREILQSFVKYLRMRPIPTNEWDKGQSY